MTLDTVPRCDVSIQRITVSRDCRTSEIAGGGSYTKEIKLKELYKSVRTLMRKNSNKSSRIFVSTGELVMQTGYADRKKCFALIMKWGYVFGFIKFTRISVTRVN